MSSSYLFHLYKFKYGVRSQEEGLVSGVQGLCTSGSYKGVFTWWKFIKPYILNFALQLYVILQLKSLLMSKWI